MTRPSAGVGLVFDLSFVFRFISGASFSALNHVDGVNGIIDGVGLDYPLCVEIDSD